MEWIWCNISPHQIITVTKKAIAIGPEPGYIEFWIPRKSIKLIKYSDGKETLSIRFHAPIDSIQVTPTIANAKRLKRLN